MLVRRNIAYTKCDMKRIINLNRYIEPAKSSNAYIAVDLYVCMGNFKNTPEWIAVGIADDSLIDELENTFNTIAHIDLCDDELGVSYDHINHGEHALMIGKMVTEWVYEDTPVSNWRLRDIEHEPTIVNRRTLWFERDL
jgi:hypothetical protein